MAEGQGTSKWEVRPGPDSAQSSGAAKALPTTLESPSRSALFIPQQTSAESPALRLNPVLFPNG